MKPRRQRKADRLLHGSATKSEIACDYAVGPLDELARQMDRKWGIDRLPEVVSVETAQKYGQAMAHLNDCIAKGDPEQTGDAARNCMRGLKAMDAEAENRGARPATGDYLEYEHSDGKRFAILFEGREWQAAKDARPDLTFYTLAEVAVMIERLRGVPAFEVVKDTFPEARLTDVQTSDDLNDPIPF